MSKSNYFSSKSVFGPLISLIDDKIKDSVKKCDSDRYIVQYKIANRIAFQTAQAKLSAEIFLFDNENAIKIQIYCVLIFN